MLNKLWRQLYEKLNVYIRQIADEKSYHFILPYFPYSTSVDGASRMLYESNLLFKAHSFVP